MKLKKGIYEHVINQQLDSNIKATEEANLCCNTIDMDDAETPQILSNYIAKILRQKLEDAETHADRIKLANSLLATADVSEELQISQPDNLLAEVINKEQNAKQKVNNSHTPRPLSGFRVSNLFTGGSSKVPLGEEIRREIASADEICFIVSFLKLSGVRIIIDDLRRFCNTEGKKLRIITTTYCGATEAKAIERLASLPNTEIHISYNTGIERLHAKSYIFLRNSGMHTAYIGSSNLSKSAQTDGLEWNVRVTNVENPHIIKNALATFDLYWNSVNFEDFQVGGIEKFYKEINRNRFVGKQDEFVYQRYNLLPHQKQILDKLKLEREEYGNYRNLVVAATGTGKTVISAFDFMNFRNKHPKCRLLFTAHREEILKQSLNTYRSVLGDANFGALWVGNNRPVVENDFDNLFVSVSMFNSKYDSYFSKLGTDYYDYIVVDEAHHSQADSYRKLMEYYTPKILLGLTATPERMDGRDLRPDFNGRISAEIRLPQALQAGLLTPFQYLCVTDNVDLSADDLWTGQKYNTERLDSVLCKPERTKNIVKAMRNYLADEDHCRALCFCVTKHHAEYMANGLTQYGFKAKCLTADTPDEERTAAGKDLREGRVNYLCVVDLFNEGVDIPEIDTVLFLRPTDSLTIFLQQLGRGLRLAANKAELTVLDFVAQANKKYDFTNRFRALTLQPEKNILTQIKDGFTLLPSGCSIVMEEKARQYILENINSAIYNKTRLIKELNSYSSTPSLSQFIENNGQDIRIIYQNNRCWTSLKRDAGRIVYKENMVTKRLEKGMGNLIHHNTPNFLRFVDDFAKGSMAYKQRKNHTYALMLYYALFQDKCEKLGVKNMYEALDWIGNPVYADFKKEIAEITAYVLAHLAVKTEKLAGDFFPELELYGCYTREEVFTLVGRQTENLKMQGAATGVFNLKEHNTNLLFVTLNKSDKDFSPTTLYNDYLINENYFHWQSQNSDSHDNDGGARYVNQHKVHNKILLFVRQDKKDGYGNTSPFHCFGYVDYVESYGDYPMNVKWKLQKPAMAQYLNVI